MKKVSFIIFIVVLIFSKITLANEALDKSTAKTLKGDAIKIHLKDATIINRQRAIKYAELSNGLSLPLSYELITMENLALIFTKSLDKKARIYTSAGIGLFHDDLVDMALTPPFQTTFPNNQFPTEHVKIDVKGLKERWFTYIENDDLDTLYHELIEILDNGRLSYKNQNCLTRHFVESIARGLKNLNTHREKANLMGLEDPKNLSLKFIKIQITSLTWAYSMDKRAFMIQKKNIPIYCQDVPVIEYK